MAWAASCCQRPYCMPAQSAVYCLPRGELQPSVQVGEEAHAALDPALPMACCSAGAFAGERSHPTIINS